MQHRRVAVRGIVIKDGKLLGVKLKKYVGKATMEDDDYWCTPGGGVDIGEPLIAALEREMIEETGVKPVIGSLLYLQQFQHEDWEHLEFFFHITNAEDYERIDLTATTHGAIEIAEVGFIDPSTETIKPAFLSTVNLNADANRGVTRIFNNFSE